MLDLGSLACRIFLSVVLLHFQRTSLRFIVYEHFHRGGHLADFVATVGSFNPDIGIAVSERRHVGRERPEWTDKAADREEGDCAGDDSADGRKNDDQDGLIPIGGFKVIDIDPGAEHPPPVRETDGIAPLFDRDVASGARPQILKAAAACLCAFHQFGNDPNPVCVLQVGQIFADQFRVHMRKRDGIVIENEDVVRAILETHGRDCFQRALLCFFRCQRPVCCHFVVTRRDRSRRMGDVFDLDETLLHHRVFQRDEGKCRQCDGEDGDYENRSTDFPGQWPTCK